MQISKEELTAIKEVIRITDRSHVAWIVAKEAIKKLEFQSSKVVEEKGKVNTHPEYIKGYADGFNEGKTPTQSVSHPKEEYQAFPVDENSVYDYEKGYPVSQPIDGDKWIFSDIELNDFLLSFENQSDFSANTFIQKRKQTRHQPQRPIDKVGEQDNDKMKLKIEIPCNDGVEMENNLNRAIKDFSEALLKKGFSKMELIAYDESVESQPIYKLTLE